MALDAVDMKTYLSTELEDPFLTTDLKGLDDIGAEGTRWWVTWHTKTTSKHLC